ncbi:MAG: type II toxin-antitoxin system VapC family toxin [Gemmataceae bacterium]|nr:type II toxin-antitoxin system VapC family toxin [Gemmataceae bacterium]
MNDILADTHAALWALFEPSKLSARAFQALTNAQLAGGRILICTITLVEVHYLVEKGKVAAAMRAGLWATLTDPKEPMAALPLTEDVARVLDQIPRAVVPDMPDRIIAATAWSHKLALVTADAKLRSAPIPTVW